MIANCIKLQNYYRKAFYQHNFVDYLLNTYLCVSFLLIIIKIAEFCVEKLWINTVYHPGKRLKLNPASTLGVRIFGFTLAVRPSH